MGIKSYEILKLSNPVIKFYLQGEPTQFKDCRVNLIPCPPPPNFGVDETSEVEEKKETESKKQLNVSRKTHTGKQIMLYKLLKRYI